MTITCGIQPTGIVTMAMEVLRDSCNLDMRDSPDMYALRLRANAQGHTYQANPSAWKPITCNNCYKFVIDHFQCIACV